MQKLRLHATTDVLAIQMTSWSSESQKNAIPIAWYICQDDFGGKYLKIHLKLDSITQGIY